MQCPSFSRIYIFLVFLMIDQVLKFVYKRLLNPYIKTKLQNIKKVLK